MVKNRVRVPLEKSSPRTEASTVMVWSMARRSVVDNLLVMDSMVEEMMSILFWR
jgi:hypothetical protein